MAEPLTQITLSVPSGATYPAEVAFPSSTPAGGAPGIVVIHDVVGLSDDTRRHCRRLADAGYVALAPGLYNNGKVRCIVQTMASVHRTRSRPLEVIESARAWLAEEPCVDPARIGVMGFCMGGGFALLAAARQAFAVAAPFYGLVPRRAKDLQGICPTIGQFGGRDLLFRKYASTLSEHLRELGVEHEVLVHEEAGHSFMNQLEGIVALGAYSPMRARYDAEVEATAWRKMMAFFQTHMPSPEASE